MLEKSNMYIKNPKGITLIILIITIVVMLILAGTIIVSISGFGELKDLKKLANDLQLLQEEVNIYYEKYKALPIGEKLDGDVGLMLEKSKNDNDGFDYYKINLEAFDKINLSFGSGKTPKDYYIVNEESHNVYYYQGIESYTEKYYGIKDIQSNFNDFRFAIENFELKTRINAIVNNGVLDIQLEVYSDLVNENIEAYKFKIDNQDWSELQSSNTFVFHNLERFKTYKVSMAIMDSEQNEIYASNNEEEVTINSIPISLTYDNKKIGTYKNPLIPAYFMPLNENNAYWQSSDGYQNGLVIEDARNGNQFVWVPVDGNIVKLERLDWGKYQDVYTDYFENIPSEITASILKNGGFYIARYETGKITNGSLVTPVIKNRIQVWNDITFEQSKTQAESIYPHESDSAVTSTLIFGTEWDAALKFISSYNGDITYPTSSIGKGNYLGTSGGDTTSAGPTITGDLDAFRQKNIYDMAGNIYDWTMEEYTTGHVARGGSYRDATTLTNVCAAAYRLKGSEATVQNIGLGFRVALYFKNNVLIDSSNIEETSFTLNAQAIMDNEIVKYEFYINNILENTINTTNETAIYNVTGKTGNTNYTCKVRAYDAVGNYIESNEIIVKTKTLKLPIETIVKVGDFVSVPGDTKYKWRVLHNDSNGLELVLYNGGRKVLSGKSDYSNAIQILNTEAINFVNGNLIKNYVDTSKTRHLGSDRTNPTSYATIPTSYVKFYGENITNLTYLRQEHYTTDTDAIATFSGSRKLYTDYYWLASRYGSSSFYASGYYVQLVQYTGNISTFGIFRVLSDNSEESFDCESGLAPVCSPKSGVLIEISTGYGSEYSPWKIVE